jgi:hypothetical protein
MSKNKLEKIKPVLAKGVIESHTENVYQVKDLATNKTFKLNETSYYIYSLFKTNCTLLDVRKQYELKYSVGEQIAEKEVLNIYNQLINLKVVNNSNRFLYKISQGYYHIIEKVFKNDLWI